MRLDPWSCLSFDVACVEYDERFTLELERTKDVPLTPEEIKQRERQKPTKLEPAHSHALLMRLLGIATDTETALGPEAPMDQMQQAAAWFRQLAGWSTE